MYLRRLRTEAQDPQFHTRYGTHNIPPRSLRIMRYASCGLPMQSSHFLLQFPWSKVKEGTESVKYLKGDLMSNELLSNMEINLTGESRNTYFIVINFFIRGSKQESEKRTLEDGRREEWVPRFRFVEVR